MKKLFSLFAALTLSVGLWAQGSVFTYTATEKLESQFNNLGTVATHDFNDGVGTVTFDGELTSIPDEAFTGCMGLISIELPESVTEIGGFLMCMNLQDVIAANVRTIGHDAFSGCNNLQSIDLSNVMTIGTNAFNYCLNLQSVFMPNVEEIGSTAFNSCQNLQSVFMPNVTTIESYTFAYCGNLQSIDLSNVTTIGNNAFQWCGLQSVTVPATLTEIGENAFVDCQQLQSVTFLGNSCNIIENAFSGVGNGTPATLNLPDSWTGSKPDAEGNWYGGHFAVPAKVGDQFVDATSGLKFEVTSLEPKTVKVIRLGDPGQGTHNYDEASYTVPATVSYKEESFDVTEIGEEAFVACTDLESVTLPESVTTIGMQTFADCSKLQSINLSNVTTIGWGAFMSCNNLQSINLSKIITIGEEAFNYCEGLTSITLGETLTSIGNSAFGSCSKLESITIPASVESIGGWAFCFCSALASVIVSWTSNIPAPETDAFAYIASPAILHVPAGTAELYEAAGWGTWFTIEAAPATFTLTGKSANQYATICLPQPIASVSNAVLYKISYGDVYKVNFVEETNFTADPAGTPYLVQAIADGDIVFTMTDATPVTDPVGVEAAKGFVASLQDEMQAVPEGYNYLLVSGGELHSAGPGCQLSKNHAYIDVNHVPETEPEIVGAPRRVTLYNVDAKSPTALGQMNINESKAKKVIDKGQFVIIRDNKAYNAQGIEVQ